MDPITLTLALTAISIPVVLLLWHVAKGIGEGIKELAKEYKKH